jgi:hypothetical protein
MKRVPKFVWLLLVIPLLGLSACGAKKPVATPTVDTAAVYTQIASTALALQTQTVLAMPTSTNTPQASPTPEISNTPEATHTPLISDTPSAGTSTATPKATNAPKATSQAGCDNMAFVSDVTIPDGYEASPGEYLTKTWRLKNLGPCKWNEGYKLVYGYGGEKTNWNKSGPGGVSGVINPGETADITITMQAPTEKGEYGAFYRMRSDKGVFFGPYVYIFIRVP